MITAFASALLALLIVLVRRVWLVARNVVTIAHEGGHAAVALLVGRRCGGIRLHSDTSGVTLSRGKPTGPGMVATALAGYLAPSLLGLGFAALLATGRVTALLWLSILLLASLLVFIRNLYGVLSVVVTGLAIVAVTRFTSVQVQVAFAYFATWFLLFAGIRPIGELQRKRWRGRASNSDADQLARLTGIPGVVWVGVFGLVAIAALALAASWLLPPSQVNALFSGK